MKQSLETTQLFGNESPESRGHELEEAYASLLDCGVEGGIGDTGIDLVCANLKDIPVIQVKSSAEEAKKFLAKSMKLNKFIPIIIGDYGRHTKEEVISSLRDNGCWVGDDVEDREVVLEGVRKTREYILTSGGSQKYVNPHQNN